MRCSVGILTGLLVLLAGVGGATPASASGLRIGGSSTVKLGDALLKLGCNDLHIQSAGTLQAQASTIRIGGNWDNQGTFDAGTGTVIFEDGCVPNMSSIAGSNTFFALQTMTSAGKTVDLEAAVTQTVLDALTLLGTVGNLLVLRSSMPGQQAFLTLQPGGSQNIDYVDVADIGATGQTLVAGANSVDSGNTTNWSFLGVPSATPTSTPTATATSTPTNTPLAENGQPCTTPGQCQSMHCVDGLCCDTACTEADHVCNLPGRGGTCLAITAAPAPALSGIGTVLGIAVLLLIAAARLALGRRRRDSGASR
jgi:hypothetical protein